MNNKIESELSRLTSEYSEKLIRAHEDLDYVVSMIDDEDKVLRTAVDTMTLTWEGYVSSVLVVYSAMIDSLAESLKIVSGEKDLLDKMLKESYPHLRMET